MMKCRKCLSKNVCDIRITPSQSLTFKCSHFKDQSKFIELPCKVGDVVYIPQRKRISVHKVTSIIIGVNNILCIEATPIIGYLVPCFFIDDIGNKVFLTEEEAEQALRKRENNEYNH